MGLYYGFLGFSSMVSVESLAFHGLHALLALFATRHMFPEARIGTPTQAIVHNVCIAQASHANSSAGFSGSGNHFFVSVSGFAGCPLLAVKV